MCTRNGGGSAVLARAFINANTRARACRVTRGRETPLVRSRTRVRAHTHMHTHAHVSIKINLPSVRTCAHTHSHMSVHHQRSSVQMVLVLYVGIRCFFFLLCVGVLSSRIYSAHAALVRPKSSYTHTNTRTHTCMCRKCVCVLLLPRELRRIDRPVAAVVYGSVCVCVFAPSFHLPSEESRRRRRRREKWPAQARERIYIYVFMNVYVYGGLCERAPCTAYTKKRSRNSTEYINVTRRALARMCIPYIHGERRACGPCARRAKQTNERPSNRAQSASPPHQPNGPLCCCHRRRCCRRRRRHGRG